MLLLRSNGTLLHMKDCIITFVKLIISKKHNFILYNALTNTDLLSYLYNIQYHLSLIITIPTALIRFSGLTRGDRYIKKHYYFIPLLP